MKPIWLIAVMFTMAVAQLAHAEITTKEILYDHNGVELSGYLALDESLKEKVPGVLVVHEWWGMNDYARSRVEKLAEMGFVAFALDMYGKGNVTKHPKQASDWMQQITSNVELWQSRAKAGLDILKQQALVDSNRIAAIGYCFGGATVQQLAYSGEDLNGVVSFHGSLIPPPKAVAGTTKAKLLICHGAQDPFVKSEAINRFTEALSSSSIDWQMISYGGAKHSFTNPDADKAGMEALRYNKSADQRSWAHMKLFFSEIFVE